MHDITVKSIEEIGAYAGEHAIPGIRFRPAREALGVSSWGMSVLELDAHCTGYPEHHHANEGHEEVYLVLRGTVKLHAGGEVRTLGAGDFVRVGAATKRKFVTLEHGVTLLALGGTPGQPYSPAMGTPSG
jgi:quercetin dioxygenase-like cupin family protein